MNSTKLCIDDVHSVEGFISKKEQKLLYKLAQRCNGNIVEIGSWKGLSTICLALGLKNGHKIYAIDPYDGGVECRGQNVNTYKKFMNNINKFKVQDKVVPMVMTSEKAFKSWNKKGIDLLWIDGCHHYKYAKYDIENWSKLLDKNGILVIHDFDFSDVKKVIFELILDSMKFLKTIDTTVIFKKDGKTGFFTKIFLRILYVYCKSIIYRRILIKRVKHLLK